ncbi:ABC transporter ATP-binding protein [Methanosarcinales archaeon]|nr:ABC transporter ATP-binding protein [Deltaproteobacteria bacterium]RLG34592.1 MAG: ABC transporter ATP-binding protein [Methanosarcinales archaeon]
MIQVQDLKRSYIMGKVEVHALKGVSFEIEQGEFVAIMGPSGSGKSTLLHQLGLLDTPTSGKILIDGVDVLRLSDREKTIYRLTQLGYVFQDYAILPELTAAENVYLPAMVQGKSKELYLRSSRELLETVGLGDRLHHLPQELSGGEQQRVAIARALINKPKILFADEPCANLDTESSRHILELFRKLNEELGQTILMVSHEEWHKKYVDRIIYLKDGLIEKM